jgi:hypothetical protein
MQLRAELKRPWGCDPLEIINNCLNFLSVKIELATTRGAKKIVVLGINSSRSPEMLRFTELVRKSVTRNCGEVVESREFKIFILPLLARRGTKYVEQCLYG